MASLDFKEEKLKFTEYWNENHKTLEQGKDAVVSIINSLLTSEFDISTVFGRIKDREEAIKKFTLKYRSKLEDNSENYEIKDHITDLIGIRIVCLYEKDALKIKDVLSSEFEIIEVTNKISDREAKEDSFGYKGLHVDLKLKEPRTKMREYQRYADLRFEIQIRTIIQDAWSVLDHKIKYKRSIPLHLKRRINTLAALFELSDREFYSIKNETDQSEQTAKKSIDEPSTTEPLDVFSFLAIIEEKFPSYSFLSYKIDGFVSEILHAKEITPQEFKKIVETEFDTIETYKTYLETDSELRHVLNPYTEIRHMLYKADKQKYKRLLYDKQRQKFDNWYSEQEQN